MKLNFNGQRERPVHGLAILGAERALAAKVDFLSRRNAYDPMPSDVLCRETHMSWVFLAGLLLRSFSWQSIWWFGALFALIAFVIYAVIVSAPPASEAAPERSA